MPPKRKTTPNTTNSQAAKAQKKTSLLINLIQEFEDLKSIEFDLFIPEKDYPTKALLPPLFPLNLIPHNYFSLLFPPNLYNIIARNINKYTAIQ
jgi:hypothetical protein